MQSKNYTNPMDKGRFGFSASGKFNAPYKLEGLLVSLTVAGGIVIGVLVTIFLIRLLRTNPTGISSGRMFEAMMFGLLIIAADALIFFVTGLIIKIITQGYECRYIADEEKFMLDYGSSHKTIYFSEVQNIHFAPRSVFRKVRGYYVTVKINGANEDYAVTSDGYLSENATPFYIIKERMELFRRDASLGKPVTPAAPVNTPLSPVKRDEIPITDRVSSILGKDAEMPGISARTRPDIVAANKQNSDPVIPDYPGDLVGKVSPTVNGYAADMPAVGADGRVAGVSPTFIGTDGRERSVRDLLASGSFREPLAPWKAVLISFIALVLYAAAFLGVYYTVYNPIASLVINAAMIISFPFIAGTIINYFKKGELYNYKANGLEFVVTSKKNKEERILYSDVQDVVYNKHEFLWFIKGYKVEILTTYGVIRYNYVCEGRRLPDTSALPFEVIRERSSIRDKR